ncbi:hypothetical protein EIP86_009196 [Pleurotus ostreatoroseus]|nr:hypothetical protein EIP86_009196 [Pleurotus ostreatoroseus]
MFDVPETISGESGDSKFPIVILDGGFGTTLQDLFHKDISTPLWSAKPVDEEPEVIIDAHLAFLRAGARVILTATYQAAYDTVEAAGYSREHAERLMRKAVRLAQAAKARFLLEHPFVQGDEIKIALSLGPFGSTRSTHEFDGIYPPPYGPPESVPASEPNANYFVRDEDEEPAIEALKQFHLERLRIFAADKETWDDIDCIAFETVPLRREIRAIRRAVKELRQESKWRPWWISTVHPNGQFPEQSGHGEGRVQIPQVMDALLDDDTPSGGVVPDGVGLNCTPLENIAARLQDMTVYLQQRSLPRPWLIVYPNGGDWDVSAHDWATAGRSRALEGEAWARGLREAVQPALDSRVWRGIILGGCCKIGPREIAGLAKDV